MSVLLIDTDTPGFDISATGSIDILRRRFDEIRAALLTLTLAEWMERFNAHGSPAAPVNFPEDLVDDPQAGRPPEGVAFLAARVPHRLDAEFPELTDAQIQRVVAVIKDFFVK